MFDTTLTSMDKISFSDIDLQNLLGGNGNVVPPDPIPNSEVKRVSADGSVGDPM